MIIGILLAILLIYTGFYPLLALIYALKGSSNKYREVRAKDNSSVACVITAYKDWEIAASLIRSIQKQSYRNFQIYLVADNCQELVDISNHEQLTVIQTETPLNSKIKSIQLAVENFKISHDAVLILDPDNLLHSHSLENLVDSFEQGFNVVQGQRVAKNLDTKIAALDALGEIYYNFNQRLAPFFAGSSATIAGSGMVIELKLFLNYLKLFDDEAGVVLAEDKLLQMFVIQQGERIAYKEDALIFDEKSTTGAQVQKQRTRWLKSYFDHIDDAFSLMRVCLSEKNYQGAFFSLMISTPPFIILVALMFVSSLLALIFAPQYLIGVGLSLLLFILSWIFALYFSHAPTVIWRAIPWIPVFMARQVLSLLGFGKAKTDFLATQHTLYLEIEDVWESRKTHFKHLNTLK
jgi:cellulose synthase/poly-beta-1,6-N-acetylglucosamine synthase-like glycosyltransferase